MAVHVIEPRTVPMAVITYAVVVAIPQRLIGSKIAAIASFSGAAKSNVKSAIETSK